MARRNGKDLQRVRRVLRNLPEAIEAEFVELLRRAGPRLQASMRSRAPTRTGALKSAIDWKVNPRSLRLRVGLLGGAKGRTSAFYGRIQDLGRRAQTVRVRRYLSGGRQEHLARVTAGAAKARLKPRDLVVEYDLRVRPMAPKRFITGSMPTLRSEIRGELNTVYERALRAITGARG